MQGLVEKVDQSKSGKAWRVKVGDGWYGASKKSGVEQMLGKTIEAVVENGQFGPWLENFKIIEAAPKPANGSSVASMGSGMPWYLPFVSNTVAHAIQVGAIKTPQDISAWAKAAYDAAQALDAL